LALFAARVTGGVGGVVDGGVDGEEVGGFTGVVGVLPVGVVGEVDAGGLAVLTLPGADAPAGEACALPLLPPQPLNTDTRALAQIAARKKL
jgi:hypothetical protein